MRRILSVAFVASTMFASALFAAEPKSGLQPGEAPPAYNVKDCTGPAKRSRCAIAASSTIVRSSTSSLAR